VRLLLLLLILSAACAGESTDMPECSGVVCMEGMACVTRLGGGGDGGVGSPAPLCEPGVACDTLDGSDWCACICGIGFVMSCDMSSRRVTCSGI